MKILKLAFSALLLLLLPASQCFKSESEDTDEHPGYPEAIIIDHTCTDFWKVPSQYESQIVSDLKVTYGHTSHGSQPVTGILAYQSAGCIPSFSTSEWGYVTGVTLNDYGMEGADDLGSPDRTTWVQATRNLLNRSGCDRNVVIWSWCGQVSDASKSQIDQYLSDMNQLEIDFPNVKFVYMTGHLDGSGTGGNLNQRNEQIRAYCRQYKKILFDFADIESWDPDGNYFLDRNATDSCDYDGGNWAQEWMARHAGSQIADVANNSCSDCAHSEKLNCVLKGGAFYWLLARLAGWSGS